MRLVDADKLNRKDVNCANVPMNFIDTAPTVEAIPKDQYENRLKADMVAMLEDLDLQIDESAAYNLEVAKVQRLIRDRIDKLKEIKEVEDGNNN